MEEEREGCDRGRNRAVSSFDGDTEPGDDESESSSEGVEIVTSEADDTERDNTPLVSGRAVSTTSRAGSSVHNRVSFDPKGRGPYGEVLTDAPASSGSISHGPDQQFAALRAGEAKILAEHIPRPQRATIFRGRTRSKERRSKSTALKGMISVKDELDIALYTKEENTLEQALRRLNPDANRKDVRPPATANDAGGRASITIL